MKRQLMTLLKEMESELEYLSRSYDLANTVEMQDYYCGKYNEVRRIYVKLKEILENDN